MRERTKLTIMLILFIAIVFIPFSHERVSGAILESFYMVQYYARQHVLLCLIPALFIAGAMMNFLSGGAIMKYFGGGTKKIVSYLVASVSGMVLAVCSCTILPLFAGIYKKGAGIGPAITFLYAGPAINILAIILTARILGWEYGLARAIGAIVFAIIIGVIMGIIYRKEETNKGTLNSQEMFEETNNRSGVQNLIYFLILILILIFAAWKEPDNPGFAMVIFELKWVFISILGLLLIYILISWFKSEERRAWVDSTWSFSKQILPLLFIGVAISGLLLGRPNIDQGLIPARWVEGVVGGNTLLANLTASILGAFMYFATLTEVPIIQGLVGAGMGEGPALALMLAGPALSLPNMLVIRMVIGTKKTLIFVLLVIVFSTISGLIFGMII